MEQLKKSHKLLILEQGGIALFSLLGSSNNGFDKISCLSSYGLGFENIKIYKDPRLADNDFEVMSDHEASLCFEGIAEQKKLRLRDTLTGRSMLLPLN